MCVFTCMHKYLHICNYIEIPNFINSEYCSYFNGSVKSEYVLQFLLSDLMKLLSSWNLISKHNNIAEKNFYFGFLMLRTLFILK